MAEESIYSVNLGLDESLEKLEAIVDETTYLKDNQTKLRSEVERQQEIEQDITKQIYERKKAYEELRLIQSSQLIGAIERDLPRDELKQLREIHSLKLAGANAEIEQLDAQKQSVILDREFARAEENNRKKKTEIELKEQRRKEAEEKEKERKLKDNERHELDQQRKRLSFEREVKGYLTTGYELVKKTWSIGSGAVKLAGATAIGGGLVGLGFGALAHDANNALFESQKYGGGTTAGDLKAARSVYGNRNIVENTDQLMATLQDKLDNITERTVFLKTLLGRNVGFNESPADLLPEVVSAVQKSGIKLRETNPDFWMDEGALKPVGLGGFDTTMIRRLSDVDKQGNLRVSEKEVREAGKEYKESTVRNKSTDPDLKRYQQTVRVFSETYDQSITSFQNNLVKLNDLVQKLSQAFGNATDALLSSKRIVDDLDILGGAIYDTAVGITDLAKTLHLIDEKSLRASEYKSIRQIKEYAPDFAEKLRDAEENPSDKVAHNEAVNAFKTLTPEQQKFVIEKTTDVSDPEHIKRIFQDVLAGQVQKSIEANLVKLLKENADSAVAKKIESITGISRSNPFVAGSYAAAQYPLRLAARGIDHIPTKYNVPESTGSYISRAGNWLKEKFTHDPEKQLKSQIEKHGISYEKINQRFSEVGKNTGIDPLLLKAQAIAESSGDVFAISPKGAEGLAQMMPATGQRYGLKDRADRRDPFKSIGAQGEYMRDLSKMFKGNPELMLAGYNAGENKVKQYGYNVPPFKETQAYVKNVLRIYETLKSKNDNLVKSPESTAGGKEEKGTRLMAESFRDLNPDFEKVAAFNDTFHQNKGGYHPLGLAGDISLKLSTKNKNLLTKDDYAKSDRAVADLQSLAKAADVKINVLNEVRKPSGKATAPHIHYSFPSKEEARKFESFVEKNNNDKTKFIPYSQQKTPSELEKKPPTVKTPESVKIKADINAKAKITVNNLTGMGINTVQGLS